MARDKEGAAMWRAAQKEMGRNPQATIDALDAQLEATRVEQIRREEFEQVYARSFTEKLAELSALEELPPTPAEQAQLIAAFMRKKPDALQSFFHSETTSKKSVDQFINQRVEQFLERQLERLRKQKYVQASVARLKSYTEHFLKSMEYVSLLSDKKWTMPENQKSAFSPYPTAQSVFEKAVTEKFPEAVRRLLEEKINDPNTFPKVPIMRRGEQTTPHPISCDEYSQMVVTQFKRAIETLASNLIYQYYNMQK